MEESYGKVSEFTPNMDCTFLLRGSITETGAVSGVIHHFYHDKDVGFEGLDMAVLVINDWLEEYRFSPSAVTLRTFAASGKCPVGSSGNTEDGMADSRNGKSISRRKESFLIRILYREHTSWQGEIRWRDHRAYFRSVLEMMALLRSALNQQRFCGTADEGRNGGMKKILIRPDSPG